MPARTSCRSTAAPRRAGAPRSRAHTPVLAVTTDSPRPGSLAVGRLQRTVGNNLIHRLLHSGTREVAQAQARPACHDCEDQVETTAAAGPESALAAGGTAATSGPVCQVTPPPAD